MMDIDYSGAKPIGGLAQTDPDAPEIDMSGAKPVERSGYLGASLKAGGQALIGAAATIIDTVLPTTSEADLAVLYKNDPEGLKKMQDQSVNSIYQRIAKNASRKQETIMSDPNLTPEAQELKRKEYATTDASEAAWASPTKIAGDVLQSAPTSIAMAGSVLVGRGAGMSAFNTAKAAGATDAMARAAAMRASGQAMATAGAVSEGSIGGAMAFNETQAKGEGMTDEQWAKSPEYQKLIAEGTDPAVAKTIITQKAARSAGQGAAVVDATVNAVGGQVLGRVMGSGAGIGKRVGAAAAEGSLTEAVQSPGEELAVNDAIKRYFDPNKELTEGLLESSVAGLVVGGASSGPMGLLGGQSHAESQRKSLEAAAAAIEFEETTGLQPEEAKAVADIGKQTTKKPRLNGLQSRVAIAAQGAGVDAPTALAVMGLESRGKANAQNPNSSANGLFQIIDSTWEELGGGDRNDEATQIRNGVAYLAKVKGTMKSSTGLDPSPAEIYMGHMLGPKGGLSLMNAAKANPDGSFLDQVSKWDAKNAAAIVKNNGFSGMTNQQVYAAIADRVARETQRLGFDTALNDLTNAQSDAPPPELGATDALMEEIDDILAMDESGPIDEETRLQAELEEKTIAALEPTEEHREIDEMNEVAEAPPQLDAPKLPEELAGASPRYGFGNHLFQVQFESDLDKAAYIIGKPGTPSKADARYLAFVMENSGMDETEARAYGREISQLLKELAREQRETGNQTITIPNAYTAGGSKPDSFVSIEEAATRRRYANPNDRVPVSSTPIAAARDEYAVGKNIRDRRLQPGEVVALNIEGPHTPAPYVKAAQETVQSWVDQFMPQSSMMLTFRTMDPKHVAGWGQWKGVGRSTAAKKVGPGFIHQLNLRNATNLGETSDGSRNESTQRKIAYSMAHEFGHALTEEEFKRDMPDDLSAKFDKLGTEEYFSDEDLARMPADTAAVLREYNDLKRRVLTDRTMSARDFIETWLSPWKTAHGEGKLQGAKSFAKMYLGQDVVNNMERYTAKEIALSMNARTDILSPHEYMAEQFARYAYSRNLFKNTPFGAQEFFGRVFEKLSKFFQRLKRDGIAEPGLKFAEWADSLTRAGKEMPNAAMPKEIQAPAPRTKPRLRSKPATVSAATESVGIDTGTTSTQGNTEQHRAVIGGRDVVMQRIEGGDWFEVNRAGEPTGASLGNDKVAAIRTLAAKFRQMDAGQRKEGRVTRAAPERNPVPKVPTAEQQMSQLGDEYTADDVKLANAFLNTSPEIQYLKTEQPEIYQELRELARAGKLDELKFEVKNYVSDDAADQMRWDHDNPDHIHIRTMAMQLENVLPKRAGLKAYFQDGMRMLANHRHYTMTMTQRAYENPFSGGLQAFNLKKNEFKTFKSRLEFRAVENAQTWAKMGKEQRALLERAMRQEHLNGEHLFELRKVNKTWRFVPTAETMAYANKLNMDEDTVKLWMDVKNSYIQHMNALHVAMGRKIQKRLNGKPALMKKRLDELAGMFDEIRGTPFLPQTRFGQYAIQVRDSSNLEGSKIVHIEFYESAAARDEGVKRLEEGLKGQRHLKVMPSNYSPTSGILRSLPPQVLGFAAEELELTTAQRAELREIADATARNAQTRKYSAQLAQISGANKELLHNYADFMAHDSNNIAKLVYKSQFEDAILEMKKEQAVAAEEGDYAEHDKMRELVNFSEKYKQHILNPAAEFHMLRSFVVLKMLWGNIKTALANVNSLTQLYALAARQNGNIAGTGAALKMTGKTLAESITKLGRRVLRGTTEGATVFNKDETWALNMAKVNGLLDETFAAQLASFSGQSTLQRMNMGGIQSKFDQIVKVGMMPQHAVENFTRRVTLLNQFNTYMNQMVANKMANGMGKEQATESSKLEAFNMAQQDLYLLQGDNTQVNRPAFMRGKASAFFIFYGYMQNMLFLMSGAQERARNVREAAAVPGSTAEDLKKANHIRLNGETVKMWMAYAALGGLMGLPGAEDLDKILGLVAKKMFGSDFSLKEYAFKLGETISENAAKVGLRVNPRSIVHGMTSDIDMFGLMPGVDMSSSMGLGQVMPGMGGVDRLDKRGGAGDFLIGALGPLGSVVTDIGKAFSDDPSMLNKMGLVLPNTIKGWAKAVMEHRDGVRYASGGKVTYDHKTQELRDLTTGETLTRFMGFQPSIVTSNKELHWMQKEKADYWTARRNLLTTQMWEANRQGDREAIADVNEEIRQFNAKADPALRLSHKDVQASMKKRKQNMKRDEARTAAAKRYKGLYKEMEETFVNAEGD